MSARCINTVVLYLFKEIMCKANFSFPCFKLHPVKTKAVTLNENTHYTKMRSTLFEIYLKVAKKSQNKFKRFTVNQKKKEYVTDSSERKDISLTCISI